jgi:hypothetical protein
MHERSVDARPFRHPPRGHRTPADLAHERGGGVDQLVTGVATAVG